MQIEIPDRTRIDFNFNTSAWDFSPVSPAVATPASPDHPLLADRGPPWPYNDVLVSAMDIGNVLNLQTQAAHGVRRPQVKPVQPPPALKKTWTASSSSSNSSSSFSSSSSGSTPTPDMPRCIRCRRSMSGSGANAVSFGQHLHYCGACTLLLESRG